MSTLSYREYLDFVEKYNKNSIPFVKVISSLLVVALVAFVFSTSISNYNNKKIEPAVLQSKYFENVNAGYFKSKQAMADLFDSFQIAGVKTEKLDSLKESSQSVQAPGFFLTLGETQKVLSQIKLAEESILTEREELKKQVVPQVYETLNNQVVEYLNQSETFLTSLQSTQEQLKDLTLAAGPNLYLPTLSDETIWQTQDLEKIKAYYENQKKEAEAATLAYTKIQTKDQLKTYKDRELTYFQLVINVSDNIIKVLGKTTNEDPQSATNIEEAYQVLVGAKRENEQLAQQLLDARVNLTSSQVYFENISSLKNRQRVIESGLVEGNKVQLKNVTSVTQSNLLNKIPIVGNYFTLLQSN